MIPHSDDNGAESHLNGSIGTQQTSLEALTNLGYLVAWSYRFTDGDAAGQSPQELGLFSPDFSWGDEQPSAEAYLNAMLSYPKAQPLQMEESGKELALTELQLSAKEDTQESVLHSQQLAGRFEFFATEGSASPSLLLASLDSRSVGDLLEVNIFIHPY